MQEDPFQAAAVTLRELSAAQPGRAEQLSFKLLQSLSSQIASLHERLADQELWKASATRTIAELREEVARVRARLPESTTSHQSDQQAPISVRHPGQLPIPADRSPEARSLPPIPFHSPTHASGSTSPPRFETSSPAPASRDASSPTAGGAASSVTSSLGSSRAEETETEALNEAARQRASELREANERQQQHGNFLGSVSKTRRYTSPLFTKPALFSRRPRTLFTSLFSTSQTLFTSRKFTTHRTSPRTFQPTQRRGPTLPRSLAQSGGGAPAAPTARTAQPPITTEPAIATGATVGSIPSAPVATAPPHLLHSVGASGSTNSQPLRLAHKLWASSRDGHHAVSCLVLSPDGSCMVSGDASGSLQLWARAPSQAEWSPSLRVRACRAGGEGDLTYGPEVNALALRGSLLLSGGADGVVKTWRAQLNVDDNGRVEPVLYLLRALQARYQLACSLCE
ncbi:MAG: hypothetical protein SGPRY_013053 [Prymnesium sp.]